MINKAMFAMAIGMAAVLAGCTSSPALTPENAKVLLQAHLKAEDQTIGLVDYEPVAARMAYRTFVDYRQDQFAKNDHDGIMHRLVVAGLVRQTTEAPSLDRSFRFGGPRGRVLPAYRYSPSQELLDAVVIRVAGPVELTRVRMVSVGEIKIDDVTNLTFVGAGTAARAEFKWHIDYDAVGRAFTGVAEDHGTRRAGFRRQDNVWVCVRP